MADKHCEKCGQIDRACYNPAHYVCPIKGKQIRDIDTDEMDACTFFMTKRDVEKIRERVAISYQETAYHYCDGMCNTSKLECGALYGDYHKCPKLIKMFNDMFDENERMHGL